MTPPMILTGSKMILTCPRSLAEHYAAHYPLELAPLPIKVEPIEVKMVWHERTQSDPVLRCIRQMIEVSLQ